MGCVCDKDNCTGVRGGESIPPTVPAHDIILAWSTVHEGSTDEMLSKADNIASVRLRIQELEEELVDAQDLAQLLILQNDKLMTEKDKLLADLAEWAE
mmetsp:Transcript_12348/g.23997  ORF Transcript_12348/g.23997 Transcript_12348/m.23997 type:complete len:98 (+) Transcript_12348:162-455(+)|eukprot:CAMPEP_0171582402 /NCGR_PEP_ID=MMETSP0961-20121227/10177_1 /TAXON_ID=87120 /ORGANISM="Aurantiochytrium limacinum, Strain ATCCMYA-1381" /LENGTH=97 /DNA_ID=CAMNT_0012139393 /DNA_START=67 /DNA_END=357 /DNA_ORIENTATION=-